VCVDQKSVNILLATPLGKKDQVAKTVQSDLSQMGARCELNMNKIVTVSLEDLSGGAAEVQGATRVHASTISRWRQEGSIRKGGKIERVRAAGDKAKRQQY
jgi:hypothetical protein